MGTDAAVGRSAELHDAEAERRHSPADVQVDAPMASVCRVARERQRRGHAGNHDRIGSAKDGSIKYTIESTLAEGVAVGKDGSIYVGETATGHSGDGSFTWAQTARRSIC